MHTVISPLQRARLTAADRPAVVCADLELTYAQMWDRCRHLAGGLLGLGLRPGDRVAVVGPNSHRYLEIYQAVPGAGLVIVPLNHRHTAAELRYALEDSGARVLFSGLGDERVGAGVEHMIDLGEGYERLLQDASPADFPTDLSDDSLAGIFYTGGTTGAAKGVMLTHRNLVANTFHMLACQPFDRDTRWLIAAPLFHAAGSIAVMATVWNGGVQIVLPAFDASRALDLIEAGGATHTLVVPTMLAALSDEQLTRPRDVSSLRRISHGASPAATATLRRAAAAFPGAELIHIYGTTETAPIATHLPHEELLLDTPRARSCGHPALGVEVRVVDSDGIPVPAGEVGEVVIRGPNVMAGYWRNPDATAAALAGGWYHSGDLGYMDEHAYIYLVDRAKDMIVTGGENVYSIEVEDVLQRHPAVGEAAVFGVPDPRWGEAVHGIVVPRAAVSEEELISHCRGAIAGYKVPKRIEFREAPLPKSGAGKVLKRELRDPYWAGRSTRVSGA